MLHFNPDKEWEKFGQNEPFYAVLVNDRFRKDQLDDQSINDFYKSGSDHIDYIFKTIGVSIDKKYFPSKALDFGCGVGRCTLPLTKICQHVVGVDISESMLKVARRRSKEIGVDNIEFIKSDEALSKVSGTFDFIHSFSTFQHIPTRKGYKIFSELTEHLSDKGVAAIEFVYHREESFFLRTLGSLRRSVPLVHNFANLLFKRPFSEPLMEKNIYSLRSLLLILQRQNCSDLHIKFFKNKDLCNVLLFFTKKHEKVPLLDIVNKINLVFLGIGYFFDSYLDSIIEAVSFV